MKYSGETYSIVVHEGEIIAVTDDYVEAANMASGINEENTDSAISEAGYDPEELDDDERDEFVVMGGFEGGYAYSEEVTIPDEEADDYEDEEDEEDREVVTEDDYFSTDRGDQFTYDELISAIDEFLKKKEQESDEEE